MSEPVVIAAHGFGLSPAAFELARPHVDANVIAWTIPGHAGAPPLGFDATVAALATVVTDAGRGAPVVLWGYSLGARLALAVALTTRAPLTGLVLESLSAGIDDDSERAARRALDERRAVELEAHGVEAFFRDWDAQPLFLSLSKRKDLVTLRQGLRSSHVPQGLASALRAYSPGACPSLRAAVADATLPVRLIAGALDTRYAAEAHALAAVMPSSTLSILEGCGHAPHMEDPRATASAVNALIARVARAPWKSPMHEENA